MILVYFAISEQKMRFKNHFFVLKKSKSFKYIFRIQKSIKIASIFKECVDTLSLLLEKLCELNRKECGHAAKKTQHVALATSPLK
jgi:hypothetical protein